MSLRQVLIESFQLLWDQPKIFVPRFFSTTISSIWILSFPGLYTGNISSIDMSTFLYYLSSVPLIALLGVFVSVMLAEMVADKPLLKESFMKTVKRWKTILGVTLAMILSTVLLYIPMALGGVLTFTTNQFVFVVAGAVFSLFLMFGFSFSIFFLPISITEKSDLLKSFSDSLNSSKRNSREVSSIMLLSLLLLGVAFSMQGVLENIGVLGFVTSRFISAVATTYLFIVSPKMYLVEESVN